MTIGGMTSSPMNFIATIAHLLLLEGTATSLPTSICFSIFLHTDLSGHALLGHPIHTDTLL
jgi:hypothetical protein